MNLTPPTVSLHIGGEVRSSGSGGTHDHLNPVTGAAQASFPLAGTAEVEEAVAKAEAVRETWRRTPPPAKPLGRPDRCECRRVRQNGGT
jgi:aldehyde dehydrogenase (NAD+)